MTLAGQDVHIADRKRVGVTFLSCSHTWLQTLLSLAKLAMLATGENTEANMATVNTELSLLEYQDEVPTEAMVAWSRREQLQSIRPLKPVELINLFIGTNFGVTATV